MSNFCTQCGAPTEPGTRYCEQCGKPLGHAAVTKSPAPQLETKVQLPELKFPTLTPKARKSLAILSIGASVSLVVLYFVIRDPSPPSAEKLTQLINAEPSQLSTLTCLDNFEYSKSPVYVRDNDTSTQAWLNVLVKAGIYSKPKAVVSGGWFSVVNLEYQHTPSAEQVIKGGKLCYSDGITVDHVDYQPPSNSNKTKIVQGSASYKYNHPAPWISSPAAKEQMPDRFGTNDHTLPVTLVLKNGAWILATPNDSYMTPSGY